MRIKSKSVKINEKEFIKKFKSFKKHQTWTKEKHDKKLNELDTANELLGEFQFMKHVKTIDDFKDIIQTCDVSIGTGCQLLLPAKSLFQVLQGNHGKFVFAGPG